MHYAIGDVHGCYDALQRLLEEIAYDSTADILWFVGDLVNRGPDSLAVLRLIYQLPTSTVVVLGNHDLHFLSMAYGLVTPTADDALSACLNAADRSQLCDFLRQQRLFHYDAELGYAMVHAGLAPQWDLKTALSCARELECALRGNGCQDLLQQMYEDHAAWDPGLQGVRRYRTIMNFFTRARCCDINGKLDLSYKDGLESVPDGLIPWFDMPDRNTKTTMIIFGHWASLNGDLKRDNVIAIDGGCDWGGRLMAVCLQTGQRFQVPGPKA
jgi:bis(5'-nucleosyl)-tetraphosphatase (symmetrical)